MLLARLSDEEQREIVEKIDETTTYKQLQEEINKLKGWNKDLGAAKDRAVAAQTSLEEFARNISTAFVEGTPHYTQG